MCYPVQAHIACHIPGQAVERQVAGAKNSHFIQKDLSQKAVIYNVVMQTLYNKKKILIFVKTVFLEEFMKQFYFFFFAKSHLLCFTLLILGTSDYVKIQFQSPF